MDAQRRDPRARPHQRRDGRRGPCCSRTRSSARSRRRRCSPRSAARRGSTTSLPVGTSAIRDAHNRDELLDQIHERTGLGGARAQRRRGGLLRLPRRRELDDARRRLRDRHGRRQHPAVPDRGPPAARRGVAAARRRPRERALPARRGRVQQGDEEARQARRRAGRAPRLVGRRQPAARRHRRQHPQPRGRRAEARRLPGLRRAGLPAHARDARRADRRARRPAGLEARQAARASSPTAAT